MRGAAHLDDNRLSDLIDGAGSDHDLAHVAVCDQCRARLESWRDATKAVSTLPPVSEDRRETAIEAALSHFGDRTDEEMDVIDLGLLRRRRHFGLAARLATAAAAVALIAGVSSAVVSSGNGSSKHQTPTAAPPPLVALGEIESSTDLVAALEGRVGQAASGAAVSGLAGSAGSAGSASSAGSAASGSATGSAAPAAISAGRPSSSAPASCSAPRNHGGRMSERATLLWKGTPAVTFVYSTSQGHTAVVEAIAGCKVLATVTY